MPLNAVATFNRSDFPSHGVDMAAKPLSATSATWSRPCLSRPASAPTARCLMPSAMIALANTVAVVARRVPGAGVSLTRTPAELRELTARRRSDAQRAELDFMRIPYRVRRGGTPAVLRSDLTPEARGRIADPETELMP